MKNLSGNPNYSNLHSSSSKKSIDLEPHVVTPLKKKELQKIFADYKDLQDKCEKLYTVRSLKEINDINITLQMLDKHFKLLEQYAE